ncbi:MAG: DotA/TraY family protein [Alphaproteobacteria bacterium]
MATQNQILKYALLPGIIPRIVSFFGSGFVHLTYMIALVYGNMRLLPPGHPYLMPENMGRYGIRHVIAEAANNLVFSRKNIDQILIFFIILTGLVLLGVQFVLLIAAVIAEQPAYAMLAITPEQMFDNPVGGNGVTGAAGPTQDIAFIILDRVFGIGDGTAAVNMFNSCISDLAELCRDMDNNPVAGEPTAFPFPFHIALHRMLWFYSMGIFWVGVSVIIYFVIAIVAETAQSGTPFGQRFNKAWAPVRFILFFSLIAPLNTGGGPNEGLNGAQLITFYIVKMGSNFATNAWTVFNGVGSATTAPTGEYMSQQRSIVAEPNLPIQELNDLIQAVHVAQTCRAGYNMQGKNDVEVHAYLVRPPVPGGITVAVNGTAPTEDAVLFTATNYNAAKTFNYQGNITVRFGLLGQAASAGLGGAPPVGTFEDKKYEFYKGNVKPLCGDITLQIQGTGQPGADTIFEGYYNMLQAMWADTDMMDRAECLANDTLTSTPPCTAPSLHPDETFALNKVNQYRAQLENAVTNGLNAQTTTGAFNLPPEIIARGWAGASIWYNRIAEMNGAVTTATLNIPKLSKLPLLMDIAMKSNSQESANVNSQDAFSQNMADNLGVNTLLNIGKEENQILTAMINAKNFWVQKGNAHQSNFDKPTGNIVLDFVNSTFGTNGIFEMRENADVHPLAQLTALGKGMMEATMRNAAYGAILSGATSVVKAADLGFSEQMGKTATKFFFAMTLVTMGMAAVLYYVLPFLPFIYFLFAISGWIKSIFEAIVAMPLWALAHLRIDGEGMPGPGATNGYFLLLEIFLRPVLIVFGFVASISIFAALVEVLNQIFDLIVANTGGYDNQLESNIASGGVAGFISKLDVSRGPVDEFFFTAIYVIICYLMGLASFKLVDLIPNNILRWMGVSITTFQENAQDPAGKLSSQVYRGATLTGNQLSGQMQGDIALLTKFD